MPVLCASGTHWQAPGHRRPGRAHWQFTVGLPVPMLVLPRTRHTGRAGVHEKAHASATAGDGCRTSRPAPLDGRKHNCNELFTLIERPQLEGVALREVR